MIYDDELTLNDRTQMLWDEVLDAEPMAAESVEDIKAAINKAIEAENTPLFTEGLAARLSQLGMDCTSDDTKTLRKELDRRYKEILDKEKVNKK